jgi:MoaA/NifB/PqqE/SkfB family radical SAM enzyme
MSKTLCVLPWMHLATHPNGGVSLCCRSNHNDAVSWAKKQGTNSLVTLDNDSLDDVINSDKFIKVRQDMIDGRRPIECEGCWRDEDAGLESKRQYENKRWAHIIDQLEKTSFIKRPNYRYIELRLGNVCNNACLTCNSYSSSKWYPDEKKISKDLPWFVLRPVENFKWFEDPEFYDELTKYSEGVEEIYINGGEPTLIKAHFRYLQNLIDNGTAQKVHLVYSLNMMDIPDNLIELWKSFMKVTVNASIDDYDIRNYYIRYPTQWDETVTSIEKLNKVDNVYWHVTQTVSILNILNLDVLNTWLETNYNKIPHHNYVLYPDYLSLAALPESYKDKIRDYYKDKLHEWQRNELYAKLMIEHDPKLLTKASQFINAVDKARTLSYKDYIPELGEIL